MMLGHPERHHVMMFPLSLQIDMKTISLVTQKYCESKLD
jgi:hypothetical protein